MDSAGKSWSWCNNSTKLMLNLYHERKDKFRDPKHKKKNLWEEISKEMGTKGYTGIDADSIDRKMRNMKKTFKTIKDNNNKTGRGRVTWEYFGVFEELFAEDITINEPNTISSFPTDDIILEEQCLSEEQLLDVSPTQPESSVSFEQNIQVSEEQLLDVSPTQPEISVSAKQKKAKKARERYQHEKKILELESQRINVINSLTSKIQESNDIQKERNELLKAFLNTSN